MRLTFQAWWCGNCSTKNGPQDRRCLRCDHPRIEKHAQVHTSERSVVYRNPLTGEHVTPARSDQPMPQVYADRGYVREEIMSMTAYEKETGAIHEASNFSPGNEITPFEPPAPSAPPELKAELINDMRAAIASGPWTIGNKPL